MLKTYTPKIILVVRVVGTTMPYHFSEKKKKKKKKGKRKKKIKKIKVNKGTVLCLKCCKLTLQNLISVLKNACFSSFEKHWLQGSFAWPPPKRHCPLEHQGPPIQPYCCFSPSDALLVVTWVERPQEFVIVIFKRWCFRAKCTSWCQQWNTSEIFAFEGCISCLQ